MAWNNSASGLSLSFKPVRSAAGGVNISPVGPSPFPLGPWQAPHSPSYIASPLAGSPVSAHPDGAVSPNVSPQTASNKMRWIMFISTSFKECPCHNDLFLSLQKDTAKYVKAPEKSTSRVL